ncbi:hypothetical protein SESBI_32754 [Sesbania bispinosa]|nr:hypothetical protein SESBI_32754 [Sesbania bispinosa]
MAQYMAQYIPTLECYSGGLPMACTSRLCHMTPHPWQILLLTLPLFEDAILMDKANAGLPRWRLQLLTH